MKRKMHYNLMFNYKESYKYFQKTLRKGSYYVKFIKFLRLFKHTLYYIFSKNIGAYCSPPHKINYVGYFDKNSLIHASIEFKNLFDTRNLYMNGEFKPMKEGMVSIYEYNGKVMVRKKYIGFQKYNRFYNELICLHKLNNIHGIPKIIFVDYKNCILYIEYIDGINLSDNRKGNIIINETNKSFYYNGFYSLLNKIHENNVIMYDLRHQNMMIKETMFFLMDFADSIYQSPNISIITKNMIADEVEKLNKEINRKCYLHS